MKKKYPATNQDKLDWADFIKNPKNIYNKDKSLPNYEEELKKIPKIDPLPPKRYTPPITQAEIA